MRIISLNLNGIRSAERKGFYPWLTSQQADIVCLQETRARTEQIQKEVFWPRGYHCYYNDAIKKGYSGVAVYSSREPDRVIDSLDWPLLDDEGRFIEARFGNLSVISIYIPSGTSGNERQLIKFGFLDQFMSHLTEWKQSGRDYIICGDWNIAHKKIDLKNWRSNQKNSGFLPEERAWMDELLGPAGWVDTFRKLNSEPDQYTWWSNRGQAWTNNTGWRIDYQITTPDIAKTATFTSIYRDERFSDHAPLIVDYDYSVD